MEHKDEPLNLNNTILSTGFNEFVLLRKNSSRGDLILPAALSLKDLSLNMSSLRSPDKNNLTMPKSSRLDKSPHFGKKIYINKIFLKLIILQRTLKLRALLI